METIISGIGALIIILIILFILKKWIIDYKNKNPIEVKTKDIRTYSEFIHSSIKSFYLGAKILLGVLILKIIYDILVYCF